MVLKRRAIIGRESAALARGAGIRHQRLIEMVEQGTGAGSIADYGLQRGQTHRHNQRRWHAFAGNVAHCCK